MRRRPRWVQCAPPDLVKLLWGFPACSAGRLKHTVLLVYRDVVVLCMTFVHAPYLMRGAVSCYPER